MARITVEKCLEKISNQFDLVLAASKRARQISHTFHLSKLAEEKLKEGEKPTLIALREIEETDMDLDRIETLAAEMRRVELLEEETAQKRLFYDSNYESPPWRG